MSKDITFIALINEAFKHDEPEKAFVDTLNRIKEMALNPEYRVMYIQFQKFLDEIKRLQCLKQNIGDTELSELFKDLVYHFFSESEDQDPNATEMLTYLRKSNKNLSGIFSKIQEMVLAEDEITNPLTIMLKENGISICEILYDDTNINRRVKFVKPGFYTLQLDNGRVLWEDELSDNDLIWHKAFPEQDLKLAADTGINQQYPSKSINLFDGEIIIKIYPGIENGSIYLAIKGL
jgi:hypothetical protein